MFSIYQVFLVIRSVYPVLGGISMRNRAHVNCTIICDIAIIELNRFFSINSILSVFILSSLYSTLAGTILAVGGPTLAKKAFVFIKSFVKYYFWNTIDRCWKCFLVSSEAPSECMSRVPRFNSSLCIWISICIQELLS